jgi:hypothetical protein
VTVRPVDCRGLSGEIPFSHFVITAGFIRGTFGENRLNGQIAAGQTASSEQQTINSYTGWTVKACDGICLLFRASANRYNVREGLGRLLPACKAE